MAESDPNLTFEQTPTRTNCEDMSILVHQDISDCSNSIPVERLDYSKEGGLVSVSPTQSISLFSILMELPKDVFFVTDRKDLTDRGGPSLSLAVKEIYNSIQEKDFVDAFKAAEDLCLMIFGLVGLAQTYLKEDKSRKLVQRRGNTDVLEHLFAHMRAKEREFTVLQGRQFLGLGAGIRQAVAGNNSKAPKGKRTLKELYAPMPFKKAKRRLTSHVNTYK
jgi:hypothetical protein